MSFHDVANDAGMNMAHPAHVKITLEIHWTRIVPDDAGIHVQLIGDHARGNGSESLPATPNPPRA